ncbi:hypothetical protein [Campylobacter sp. RM16192]|uniref:hypothetical protein n=1 Tax=Campylobacter sp. RM16192 TaxID=1660080 RepID=UPI001554FA17|nr:hypothetical protein [Campylobacter sp. RM16192]
MNLATILSKKFEFKSAKSDKFADFAKSIMINIDSNGIETKPKTPLRDRWFQMGLNRGYFIIDKQKINSLFVFQIFTKLCCMLNNIRPLVLDFFPLLDEYKIICNKLNLYNSKKTLSIQKDFVLTAMVYYLFQNYPNNLLNFIKQNKLTYREFIHGFNDIPFWYKEIVGSLIPPQNKIGRLISENEVVSAIRYLRSIDKIVNQKNVADVIGCHYTVHRQFVRIYKQII